MNIEYLKLSDLKPYGNNARRHTPTDIDAIRASIRRFGFNDPVGIWGKDNVIVEGHGRYEAARLEGRKAALINYVEWIKYQPDVNLQGSTRFNGGLCMFADVGRVHLPQDKRQEREE